MLIGAPCAAAQPWMLERGASRVALGMHIVAADERFDHSGALTAFDDRLPDDAPTAYRARTLRIAAAHGLLDGLTLFGEIPIRSVVVLGVVAGSVVEHALTDLGDASVGFRLSLAERLGLPGVSDLAVEGALGLPLGYRRNVVPTTGSGQVDFDLGVRYDHRFLGDAVHVHAATGYRFRSPIYALSRLVDCPPPPRDGPTCFRMGEELSFSDEGLGRLGVDGHFRGLRAGLALGALWSLRRPQPVQRLGGVFQPERFEARRLVYVDVDAAAALVEGAALSLRLRVPAYGANVLGTAELGIAFEVQL